MHARITHLKGIFRRFNASMNKISRNTRKVPYNAFMKGVFLLCLIY